MKCISEDSFRISNHILHKDFNRWDLKLTMFLFIGKNKLIRTHPENSAASSPPVQLYVSSISISFTFSVNSSIAEHVYVYSLKFGSQLATYVNRFPEA